MLRTINHFQLSFKNDHKQLRIDTFKTLQNYQSQKSKKMKKQQLSQLQFNKVKKYITMSQDHQTPKINSKNKRTLNPEQLQNNRSFKIKTNRNLKYYLNRHKIIQLQVEQILRKSKPKQEQHKDQHQQLRLSLSFQNYLTKNNQKTQRYLNQQSGNFAQKKNYFKKQPSQRSLLNPNRSYYLKMKRIIHQNIKNKSQHKKLEILTQKSQQKSIQKLKKQNKIILNSERCKKYRQLSLKQLIYEQDQHEICPLSPSLQKKAQGMRLNFKNLATLQPFMLESIDESRQNLIPYLRLNQNKCIMTSKQKSLNPLLVQQSEFANFFKYKKRKCKFLTNRKISNKTQRMVQQLNS